MKITELLDVKSIALNVNVSSKDETIDKLIDLMYESGKISNKSEYKKGILAREALSCYCKKSRFSGNDYSKWC